MRLAISGNLLGRNVIFAIVAQALPLLIGLVAVPVVLKGLGSDRFGLLSLVWIMIGYFSVLDLGLGRAVTKYAADAIGRGDNLEIASLFWTSVSVQTILGLMGAILLVGIAPFLVDSVLNVSLPLREEALKTLLVLASSIPLVLISGSLSGILEARQRSDLVSPVRMIGGLLTYVLPVIGTVLHVSLFPIVASIVVARLGLALALLVLDFQVFPDLARVDVRRPLFMRLFRFGGWVTISSLLAPFLVNVERFLIAHLVSLSAIAYYAAPYEMSTRLSVIPSSLMVTVFPAFSTLSGSGDRARASELFVRSVRYVLLALAPVVILLSQFAAEIMKWWLGDSIPRQTSLVLQILAVGALTNALAYVPLALLQGVGRPDLPARFYLLEVPLYLVLAWNLIGRWGIAGAALAWTLRVGIDSFLLFAAALKLYRIPVRSVVSRELVVTGLGLLLFAGSFWGMQIAAHTLPLYAAVMLSAALLCAFGSAAWVFMLDSTDRTVVLGVITMTRGASS